MSELKEFVCTFALPSGSTAPPRIIALYQEQARYYARREGIEPVEEDYRIVIDPFDFESCSIIYCVVRGKPCTPEYQEIDLPEGPF